MLTIATHSLNSPLSPKRSPNEDESDKNQNSKVLFKKDNNNTNNIPLTTQESPKSSQNLVVNNTDLPSTEISSSKSSFSSASTVNFSDSTVSGSKDLETTSQEYIDSLIKKSNKLLKDTNNAHPEVVEVLNNLTNCLVKTKHQANSYRIRSELLSISSKDADMRYEVENDLIKKEVESLKHQSENREYLMSKINHQKQTLKKYKNEIINKNKEIIDLTNKLNRITNDKKRKLFRSNTTLEQGTQGNMLDTLGLLASQVLTEEEQNSQSRR